jgi:hypothetical protein
MAQANSKPTTTRLSALIKDPFVRSAFARAERDLGDDHAAMAEEDHPRRLDGGAAERLCQSTVRRSRALVEA